MPSSQPIALEIKNLSVSYGQRNVLNNVSLSLPFGDSLGIMGYNGSGKSTLLKAIFNKVPRQSGKVLLFGNDVSHLQDYELVQGGISYMVQGGLIFPSLTIEEHLSIATLHLPKNERKLQIDLAFDSFQALILNKKVRAGNLSGGQRQMLSLGILVAQKTKVWLLDEPTAGLDEAAVEFTIDFLKTQIEKLNISLLLIEHNSKIFRAIHTQQFYDLNDENISLFNQNVN